MIKKIIIVTAIFLLSISLIQAKEQDNGFVYDSKGKRDPFLSLVSPEGYLINIEPFSESSEISIEGIIYDPQGTSLAIINGEVLKAGDTIGRFEVIKIGKGKVILLKDSERFEIELREEK